MTEQPQETSRRDSPFETLLEHLKQTRGFDFSGYKRTSLERRIRKRMQDVKVEDYTDYLDYLEVHPDEFAALFDTILINVTGFFRDPQAWEYTSTEVVPRLLQAVKPEDTIRVWCAGCASGEETYTMAMVLAEALGEEAFMERVKIYATDVDEHALTQARLGTYTPKQVEGVPPQLLERYFEQGDQRYAFRRELRRTLIFGRNDLTQDAPISRIDLLVCRNTLMYFNAETQARILNRFHFALNPWGYLFLGKSEMLITLPDLFRPLNVKRRVFSKVVKATLRERLRTVARANNDVDARPVAELRDAVLDATPGAQVVIDAEGVVTMVNADARTLFSLSSSDVGRPLKDLELSYRPVDLRSNLETAYKERRLVSLPSVNATPASGEPRELEVQITPMFAGDEALGAAIVYQDLTRQRRLEQELETSNHELQNAYEELQSTVEELETTNEELHSTNEELETTNEELQSANEELETMNEELQSTNEELETINTELRERSLELDQVNAFLEGILASMGGAVIVVDREQNVQVWNAESADLWGVRSDEAQGQHLLGLEIGLPLDDLRTALRAVLAGAEEHVELVLDAINRRGRTIRVKVTCLPLSADGAVNGAIVTTALLDEDVRGRGPAGSG